MDPVHGNVAERGGEKPASLMSLAAETVSRICEFLDPVDVASFRLASKKYAGVARRYLAPTVCEVQLTRRSFDRVEEFIKDKEWKHRIEEIQYNFGNRIDESVMLLDEDTYMILDAENTFSDPETKKLQFEQYHAWHSRLLSQEISSMTRADAQRPDSYAELRMYLLAAHILRKLKCISLVLYPCTTREFLSSEMEQTIKPSGLHELKYLVKALDYSNRSTPYKVDTLRAIGIDQLVFVSVIPPDPRWSWINMGPVACIKRLDLLIKDEYCRKTSCRWTLPNLKDFLALFPRLEELTLGLDVCEEPRCLGQYCIPTPERRNERMLPIESASLDDPNFNIPQLQRLTLKNVRWTANAIIRFVNYHCVPYTLASRLREVTMIECELENAIYTNETERLRAHLVGNRGVALHILDESGLEIDEIREYDEDDDIRFDTEYVLYRDNGMDYRVHDNVLCIRKQLGGTPGERVLLDSH